MNDCIYDPVKSVKIRLKVKNKIIVSQKQRLAGLLNK